MNATDTETAEPQDAGAPAPRQMGFLLLPQFSMISLAAAIDPLRMANRLSGRHLYEWPLYCPGDAPVTASNGMLFRPTRRFGDGEGLSALFVVAGYDAAAVESPDITQWLRQLARAGITLGATSTGTLLLARAGLLQDRRCTIHWENADSLREEFPRLHVTNELYEADEGVLTCSGGVAGLDMMLELIARDHGEALANAVAEQAIHPSIRPAHAAQRMSLEAKHRIRHPRLLRAVEIMRAHLDEQLPAREIAESAGISPRQLERLFRRHFDRTPRQFYLELRLDRAHDLLRQSTLSILEIASACGFSSSSHFARCYRRRFGRSPGATRSGRGDGAVAR
ncbi:GlxA family transcriptional regulator [Arhodomonas aquaeolei]|uniref:GlxA family transcriptional regulator n=1 Tax=Arhodomonas aquaeolei TaxID=2369 RepID=UPI0003683472|nr:GlxA family transcriptional regulator [Arhodomonas aquaeolei]